MRGDTKMDVMTVKEVIVAEEWENDPGYKWSRQMMLIDHAWIRGEG